MNEINKQLENNYKLGFSINLEEEYFPKGIDKKIITMISQKKNEPQWLLDWRLQAFEYWKTLKEPNWASISHPPINYQDITYFGAPKNAKQDDKISDELMAYYEKLGVPLNERLALSGNIAVDAVLDSISVGTTFKEELLKHGVIFCSFSEAVQQYPELVKKYLGTVVSYKDNYFAALNSAVFSDGSFAYIPKGVKCPKELSTYFRINQANIGQFERTLIIADEGSYVSYLEGCFLAGTLIHTPSGKIPIEKLTLKHEVFDHNGDIQTIKSLMQRFYHGEVFEIHINNITIKTTSEHPFLIIKKTDKNNIPQWVEAKNIQPGDYVFSPHHRYFKKHSEIHKVNHQDNSIIKKDGQWTSVSNIIKYKTYIPVYNFEVSNSNTYLVEGFAVHNCSAPARTENQLHAAVVELIAHDNASIKYSTVQNWYPGDIKGNGGVYNFVTKRGEARGYKSHISWTQVETGSAITWKYPSVILRGNESIGEFYSVAITNHYQQADTGTKMIHIGEKTKSTIISKSISAGESIGTYRGLVRIASKANESKNMTQCDSLIFGNAIVNTFPYIENNNYSSELSHEATTSKITEEHLNYLMQRGISEEQAKNMIVNGFCKSIFQKLPAEFAVEAQRLIGIVLEGSIG